MFKAYSDITILIADDNPDHLRIATTILKKLNYKIIVATNGLNAYNLIQKKAPTLILLDVNMPEIDGFTLCKTLKNNSKFKDIPIIFMTASNDLSSINKGFEYGAQDYVLKPYNESEFLSRIKTHLSLRIKTLELESSYKELDSFCYTVSHDLKSPIRVLDELVHLLSNNLAPLLNNTIDTTSNIYTSDYICNPYMINDILNRLSQKSIDIISMIDRLLEVSKVQQKPLKLESINLNLLLEELNGELLIGEEDRDIELSICELPIIKGDITLIYFLFQNIISNALKFTRPIPKTLISIDYKSYTNYIELYIKDNGVGFDPAYSNKLFKPFERLHSQNEFPGTGLGLSICKKILYKHKGNIFIESELNVGTTVILRFPTL